MIVCVCRGVSDRQIAAAIDGGAKCVDSLERCGIGGDCRGCEQTLVEMIAERAAGDPGACSQCCARARVSA